MRKKIKPFENVKYHIVDNKELEKSKEKIRKRMEIVNADFKKKQVQSGKDASKLIINI